MKQEVPTWLIERIEDIDSYIGVLRAAKDSLLSLSISPVDILTDIASDIVMILRKSYQANAPYTGTPNPEIIFDESRAGELGLPPQTYRKFQVRSAYSPQMERFLFHLAIFFSRSLKKDFSFQEDFIHILDSLQEFLPPGLTGQKSYQAEKTNKKIKVNNRKKIDAYYRRRRRRQ